MEHRHCSIIKIKSSSLVPALGGFRGENGVATVLVARNNLFREGLLLILGTTAFRVCKVAATIDDLSPQPTRTSGPFLYLIGTGGDHAVTAPTVERLRKQNPSARIVVLSDRCELNDALVMLRAGADGYLFAQISRDALIKSLDLVMLGVTILPAAPMRLVGEDYKMDSEDDLAVPAAQTDVPTLDHMPQKLSQQETRILRCLIQGESTKLSHVDLISPKRPSKSTSRRSFGRLASAIALRRPFGRKVT